MEIEMRVSRSIGLLGVVIATSMLLTPVSFAQGRHDSAPSASTHTRSYAGYGANSYQAYPNDTPQDYSSSYRCINGYRWITQQMDAGDSPAANATPVRCR
jgi:hypothetical protein